MVPALLFLAGYPTTSEYSLPPNFANKIFLPIPPKKRKMWCRALRGHSADRALGKSSLKFDILFPADVIGGHFDNLF
jgi:hypothetical protein